jgi:hypothetical protein
MAPIIESGEEILLTFDVGYNPGIIKSNKTKAHLTTRRLIFETKPVTSIYFSSIVDLKLSSWQGTGKIIEVNGKKVRFYVIFAGGGSNDKTVDLFNWLDGIKAQKEMPADIKARIIDGAKDFKKGYKLFGKKFDVSNPYSLLALLVLSAGILGGGAIGAGVAFLVSAFIVSTGGRADYSTAKKLSYTAASIIAGVVVFSVLALVFLGGIHTLFGEKMSPEEEGFLKAANALKASRDDLGAAMDSRDYLRISPAVTAYNRTAHNSSSVFVSGCADPKISKKYTEICGNIGLLNRCNMKDAEITYSLMKLGYASQTMSQEECISMLDMMRGQAGCEVLGEGYTTSEENLAKLESICAGL